MIKKLIPLVIAATVLTLTVGCKGKDSVSNDPRTVLITFFERMAKKDIDGASKLATKDSKGTMELMKKAMDAAEKMGNLSDNAKKEDPSEEFKKMKVGEAIIDGNNATVSVTNPSKDNNVVNFPLKKEDGSWKVDFSMGTLMKMGMDQAGKNKDLMDENISGFDSIGASDKINNFMNGDSLKQGLEKLDSLMKSIDPEQMKKMQEALKNLQQ